MSEIISLRAAAKVANVSHTAIKQWCDAYNIGELRDGRWHIDRAALKRIMRARAVLERG